MLDALSAVLGLLRVYAATTVPLLRTCSLTSTTDDGEGEGDFADETLGALGRSKEGSGDRVEEISRCSTLA